ncbi:BTB/POZ domain-containing protein 6-like [Oculina patagonica]
MSTLKVLAKSWPMDHKERCKSMFNNEILSDVKFVVQASRNSENGAESDNKRSKIAIPAHKFLLSIYSPVFFAMFCGAMAETREHIDLPDCEYEGMLELLRFIYTDEVCLNGNNVMQVLYLAEKYMIPSLTSECTEYLGKNLDLSDVFCVFKHAEQYEKKDLLCHCWDLIDKETEEALKSNEFLSMEKSFLNQLVERNRLTIREVDLFKAVDCWAKEECKRQQLDGNGSVKRQVLGEQVVKNIRFPTMKQNEFKDVVLPSQILEKEETSNIMEYFRCRETSAVGFPVVQRLGPLLRCCRFKSFLHGPIYKNYSEDNDWLDVRVDKDIVFHGVSLLGDDDGIFNVELTVVVGDEDGCGEVCQSGTFTSRRKECSAGFYYGFDVILDEPFALTTDLSVAINVSVDGPGYYPGNEALDTVDISGVKFVFNRIDVPPSRCVELLFRLEE